jgi:hypothetical protein
MAIVAGGMKQNTLKEALSDWRDFDSAESALAISLGLMTPETNFQTDAKHVFWSDNPTGNMLSEFLTRLVQIGVLEYRETENDNEYRWNPAFKGSWEK